MKPYFVPLTSYYLTSAIHPFEKNIRQITWHILFHVPIINNRHPRNSRYSTIHNKVPPLKTQPHKIQHPAPHNIPSQARNFHRVPLVEMRYVKVGSGRAGTRVRFLFWKGHRGLQLRIKFVIREYARGGARIEGINQGRDFLPVNLRGALGPPWGVPQAWGWPDFLAYIYGGM